MLQTLVFNKETERVYCIDENGVEYANFPISFNYWKYGGGDVVHSCIPNGVYPISNDTAWDMDYGYDQGPSYGTFWIALDRERDRGFHGWSGWKRSLISGTFGCIRGENECGEEICRAIERSINAGIVVTAKVVGNVDESKFCLDGEGEQ